MSTLYARLIEIALGASADAPLLAVIADQPANPGTERKVSGSFSFPRTCLPDASEVIVLPVTENYPKGLQDLLAKKRPSRLLVAPPFLHHRFMPETMRDRYPRWNYEVIALQAALEVLPDGAKVAAIMPAGFFQGESSRSVRSRVFADSPPKLLITHAHSLPDIKSQTGYDRGVQLGLPMHGEFRLNTVVVEVRSADRCIRFFKCMDAFEAGPHEEVVADLSQLLKQGGGQTKHGYVIREGLPTDAPLIHELYDPAFISKQQSITAIGEVRQLSDLAEIRLGIPLARHPQ